MPPWYLAVVALGGVLAIMLTVVWGRIHPFVALLAVSIAVGLASGMTPPEVIEAITSGMGGTLGFVAVVVGLGSMFGTMLEVSGGAERLAERLVQFFGSARAAVALGVVGFLVCIPVFLDVAVVMLLPLAVGVSRQTGRSVTAFAFPMLAGMAVTHTFVPPTPGPTAVAQLLHADLGWVIVIGVLAGLPTLLMTAPFASTVLARSAPGRPSTTSAMPASGPQRRLREPSVGLVAGLLILPLVLIVGVTVARACLDEKSPWADWLLLIGHPFTALLIGTVASFSLLGRRLGMTADEVQRAAERSLEPAGVILLVTGAGGVFKQVLIASGAGEAVATGLADAALPPLVLAWLVAAAIRVLQGSATVAMLTAAGLLAPLVEGVGRPEPFPALMTIAIAAGATTASHVNDSGFWLVGRFLGLTVAETLKSWTVLATMISVIGLGWILALEWVWPFLAKIGNNLPL